MTRAWFLIGLSCLTLTGCGQRGSADRAMIECAIGPEGGWAKDCPIERQDDLLTLRHANGGFRRFRIVSDGRGIVSADGAEDVNIRIIGNDRIEIDVGEDRYRLPAILSQGAR